MAYMIHITRNPAFDETGAIISLEEWAALVACIDGVRLAEGDYAVRLPETGQTFTLRNNGGDAEVLHPQTGVWQRTFRWDGQGITFVGGPDFANGQGYLRTIARQLAAGLQAVVCGQEGELYE